MLVWLKENYLCSIVLSEHTVFHDSLFNCLHVDNMIDPRGTAGAADSTEEEVAMDTSSVHSEGSERESAVQPQVCLIKKK